MHPHDIAITTSDFLSYRKPNKRSDPLHSLGLPSFMKRFVKECSSRTPQRVAPPPLPEVTPRTVPKDHIAHARYVSYEKARRRNSCQRASQEDILQPGFRKFLQGCPYSEKYAHSLYPTAKLTDDLQSLTKSAYMFQHMGVSPTKSRAVHVIRIATGSQEKPPKFIVQNSVKSKTQEEPRQVRLVRNSRVNQRNQPVQVTFSATDLS